MKVECPQCGTHVEKPLEGDPLCPNCGYGSHAARAPTGVAAGGMSPLDAPEGRAPAGQPRPPYGEAPEGTAQRTSGMAIAGCVLGLITLLLAWSPSIGLVTLITWPLALIFSIVGLVQVNRSQGALGGKGLAVTGLVLCLVSLIIIVIVVSAAVMFVLVSDLGADRTVSPFPNVLVERGTDNADVIMEHRGGDCVRITDYTFRLNGVDVHPVHEGGATRFCVGDKIALGDGSIAEGTDIEVVVIDTDALRQVYKRTI